jgi:hypothetical protein
MPAYKMNRNSLNFESWIKRGVVAIFALTALMFVAIIGFWIYIGVVATDISNHPEKAGESIGRFVGGFNKAVNDAQEQ